MNERNNIERTLADARLTTDAATDERILADAVAAMDQLSGRAPLATVGKILMRRKLIPIAAAATVAVVATLAMITIDKSTTVAYAMQQTIEANQGLRTIHIRISPSGNGMSEAWMRLSEAGEPEQMRMEFPVSEDGYKVAVWDRDVVNVWFKRKGSCLRVRDKHGLSRFEELRNDADPVLQMETLVQKEARGEAVVRTVSPQDPNELIRLYVSCPDTPGKESIYYVDPKTKLLGKIEVYQDEASEPIRTTEFLNYNEPIAPEVFTLKMPDDVMVIDWTANKVGLAQGDLADEEIAVKVVEELLRAMIAKDYDAVGTILGGIPADKVAEWLGGFRVTGIVFIGEPAPSTRCGGFVVPAKIKVKMSDGTAELDKTIYVRQVEGQPGRWHCHGGL